jgi:putative acetyltransferase
MAQDDGAIAAVVAAAFGGHDEGKLVETLRRDGDMVCEFVAVDAGAIVGHIAFSRLDVRAGERSLNAAALAPLAAAPHLQRQGIGDALTRHALARLSADGCELAVVLGHPAYYPRFGFSPLLARLLDAPYSGPSFMALELKPGAVGATRWTVAYPRAFSG